MHAPRTELRSGRRYRKIRADFVARAQQRNTPCWLHAYGDCVYNGKPVNYQAVGRTGDSPELDHARPASTHPHLVTEPSNFRIAHAACNQARGARAPGNMHKQTTHIHTPMHKNEGSCINQWVPTRW